MEAETLANIRGDSHALVDTLADTLEQVEVVTLGDSLCDASELNDPLADTLSEVQA